MDELKTRHELERRDLLSRITQKLKNSTKKTRKGVKHECDRLEQEMGDRHGREVAELAGAGALVGEGDGGDGGDDDIGDIGDNDIDIDKPAEIAHPERRAKKNRQKERLARRAAGWEAQAAEAAAEAAVQPDVRAVEKETMAAAFARAGRREKAIMPTGHCLYAAFADQLSELGVAIDDGDGAAAAGSTRPEDQFRTLRRQAGNYMKTSADEFAPFLDEPVESYASRVAESSEWGGQVELVALSKVYDVCVAVVTGTGRVERIGGADGDGDGRTVWLAYSGHMYGLGAHYNSLRRAER